MESSGRSSLRLSECRELTEGGFVHSIGKPCGARAVNRLNINAYACILW